MAVCDRGQMLVVTAQPRAVEGGGRAQAALVAYGGRAIEGGARWNVAPIFVTDNLPPVLDSAFSPAAGTITRSTPVLLPLADTQTPQSKVTAVAIWASYGDGTDEVIYEGGTGFHALFAAGSSISSGGLNTPHIGFTLARTGGWRHPSTTVRTFTTDQQGNSSTFSAAYTVSDAVTLPPPDTTAPVVMNISPPPGTPLARQDAVSLDVTDASAMRRVIVAARFEDGSYEIAHDGTDWAPRYAGFSTRQAISGGYRFTVRRRLGWPSGPTIVVFPIDIFGNEG